MKEAESLGYTVAWFADSQLMFREVYVTLVAVAASTRRIRLGTSITNPVTRHPTVTASAASSLDEVSSWRFTLGLARGDSSVMTIGLNQAFHCTLQRSTVTDNAAALM